MRKLRARLGRDRPRRPRAPLQGPGLLGILAGKSTRLRVRQSREPSRDGTFRCSLRAIGFPSRSGKIFQGCESQVGLKALEGRMPEVFLAWTGHSSGPKLEHGADDQRNSASPSIQIRSISSSFGYKNYTRFRFFSTTRASAPTTRGSNWVPAQRSSSLRARSTDFPWR